MPAWPRRVRVVLTVVLISLLFGSVVALGRAVAGRRAGERSQLEEKIDGGSMEKYLDTRDEKRGLLHWIRQGAPKELWPEVEPVLGARCVSCHNGVTMRNLVPLDRYEPASRVASLRPLLARKIEWGSMERYLGDSGEKGRILSWIERGATEREWSEVRPILMKRCASCHNPQGVPGLVRLDRYPPVARIASPPARRADAGLSAPVGLLVLSAAGLFGLWRTRSEASQLLTR